MYGGKMSNTDGSAAPSMTSSSAPTSRFTFYVSRFTSGPLRQAALAILLGAAILGTVYFVDRGANQTSDITPVNVPGASGKVLRAGEPAPDFTITSPDGQPISLAQFKGRPVWINFWASWCAPCRAEFPEMDALYRQQSDTGLVLLAISFNERPEEVVGYVERARPAFTIAVDPKGAVAGQYRVLGLPTHVFIDAEGIVRDVRVGPMNQDLMRQKLTTILPAGR